VVVAQAAPTAEQPHVWVPPLHSPPQQSVDVLHAPVATQPQVPIELHTTPLQQSAVRVHALPIAAQPQCDVFELQTPPQH
jgi:hypothetical protein